MNHESIGSSRPDILHKSHFGYGNALLLYDEPSEDQHCSVARNSKRTSNADALRIPDGARRSAPLSVHRSLIYDRRPPRFFFPFSSVPAQNAAELPDNYKRPQRHRSPGINRAETSQICQLAYNLPRTVSVESAARNIPGYPGHRAGASRTFTGPGQTAQGAPPRCYPSL